jgi:hypothetical protein
MKKDVKWIHLAPGWRSVKGSCDHCVAPLGSGFSWNEQFRITHVLCRKNNIVEAPDEKSTRGSRLYTLGNTKHVVGVKEAGYELRNATLHCMGVD